MVRDDAVEIFERNLRVKIADGLEALVLGLMRR